MTNLEFIEKEIYINKNKIENDKKHLISLEKYKLNDELEQMITTTRLETNITIYEANIKYLQQIKTVLEAWEIAVLKEVDLFDVIYTTDYKQYKSENIDLLEKYFLNKKEYEIIKKALEVNNETS